MCLLFIAQSPSGESWLKLSMRYYLKTRAGIDNPAHHALHEFIFPQAKWERKDDPAPDPYRWSQGIGSHGFGRDQFRIWSGSLRIPSFPPGTHNYNPKRHNLIEGVSSCMISRQEAQANLVSIMKLKDHTMNFILMAPILNQNGETTCRPLSKGLQHRLCCWGYSHHFGTGLLPGHGPCSPWFRKK